MTFSLVRRSRTSLLTVALCLASTAQALTGASLCAASAQGIPERSSSARSAREFFDAVSVLSERQRDGAIRNELIAGNMPRFLRNVRPVSLNTRLPDGSTVHLTLCVLPDYLSIGSDDDFVLMPMGLDTAISVANQLGFTLPTPYMVDLIYSKAAVHMSPQPLPAGDQMRSSTYYRLHDAMVKQQREKSGLGFDALTAGHKKDLVLSTRLWSHPGHVAIYGWQKLTGVPIQPLSTVHGAHYADYSHGVRLVGRMALVNGVAHSIDAILGDKLLAPILSREGRLPSLAAWLERNAVGG